MNQRQSGSAQASVLDRSRQNIALSPWRVCGRTCPPRTSLAGGGCRGRDGATGDPPSDQAGDAGSHRRGQSRHQLPARGRAGTGARTPGRGRPAFIVPAMGSHGGGTAEGQIEVLAAYGITEAGVGAPIRASMDTVELGEVLDGVRVFFDRIAFTEADAILPVARIKPHSDFRGELESGLHKMLGIGLGKHRGASYLHAFPLERFGELMAAVGTLVLNRAPVPFGIAIVEDGYDEAAIIEAVPRERMAAREAELLRLAKEWLRDCRSRTSMFSSSKRSARTSPAPAWTRTSRAASLCLQCRVISTSAAWSYST